LGNAFVLANQAGPPVSLAAVVRLLPEIADVHAHFAADLLQMKRFDDAVVELQETLRLNSNYPGALNALVQARQLAQQPSPGILK
jgi:predicted Zn-dependent protease